MANFKRRHFEVSNPKETFHDVSTDSETHSSKYFTPILTEFLLLQESEHVPCIGTICPPRAHFSSYPNYGLFQKQMISSKQNSESPHTSE